MDKHRVAAGSEEEKKMTKVLCKLTKPVAAATFVLMSGPLLAANSTDQDWEYVAEIYFWGPNVDTESPDGTNTEVEFSDLAEIARGGFMGAGFMRKGKWRFGIDAIYLEVDDRIRAPVEPGVELNEVKLQVGYVSPMVAYEFARTERSAFAVYGGARYLWGEPTLKFKTDDPAPPGRFEASESESGWDGFVGLHGTTHLNENWYLGYQADIGTGDSDVTYQALGGINYRFRRFDATAGYRWMRWDINSDTFETLEFNGPYLGVKIFF